MAEVRLFPTLHHSPWTSDCVAGVVAQIEVARRTKTEGTATNGEYVRVDIPVGASFWMVAHAVFPELQHVALVQSEFNLRLTGNGLPYLRGKEPKPFSRWLDVFDVTEATLIKDRRSTLGKPLAGLKYLCDGACCSRQYVFASFILVHCRVILPYFSSS